MGAAEADLTESSALEECCCGPMFLRESRGLSKHFALEYRNYFKLVSVGIETCPC